MIKLELRKAARWAARPVPDLPSSRPRPVRLTGLGWFLAIFGVLLPASALVAGLWIYSSAVRSRRTSESIERQGVPAYGYVVELTSTRGDHPRYYVTYLYNDASGQSLKRRNSVDRAFWAKLRAGNIVDTRYMPSDPSQSWIRGFEPRGVPAWMGPLVALHLALAGIIPWYAIRRQWMLLAEGRPAEARVTELKKVRGQHGPSYHVRYEFITLSGAAKTGKYATQRSAPVQGGSIRIIYNPDDPSQSMPYPLPLVRPA